MSADDSPNVPAERDRREAVREKAQQVQAKQWRARILRRVVVGVGGVAVAAGAVTGVAWAVGSAGSESVHQPVSSKGDGFPVTVVAGVAGVEATVPDVTPSAEEAATEAVPEPAATETKSVDIRVYVDYLSQGAREFQLANAAQLSEWVDEEAATLTYYPVAMLTSKSNGTKYSLRAASASACVATKAPDAFFKFNHSLLVQQPQMDSDGMSDEELADLAVASGASPKDVRDCIEEERFLGWARQATDRALDGLPDTDGVALTGTPMVLVNGVPYVGALDDPKEFAQFVLTIDSDAYYRTPTPTPTPTPSATVTETVAPPAEPAPTP